MLDFFYLLGKYLRVLESLRKHIIVPVFNMLTSSLVIVTRSKYSIEAMDLDVLFFLVQFRRLHLYVEPVDVVHVQEIKISINMRVYILPQENKTDWHGEKNVRGNQRRRTSLWMRV